MVISTGQWFLKTAIYWEKGTVIGCHYCKGRNLTDVSIGYVYRRTLQEVFQFINSSPHKPIVYYRYALCGITAQYLIRHNAWPEILEAKLMVVVHSR